MPIEVFAMVLCAALVHAGWNALVKADGDRLKFLLLMQVAQLVLSLALLPFFAMPQVEAWPYLVASACVSLGYVLFLAQAYRSGDLSHVYPLARGTAPLIVAAVSIFFLGERLSLMSQIAVLLIGFGITSLSLTRGADGFRDTRMVGYALGTGCFIATYTLIDGVGVRASSSPHSYVVWLSFVASALISTVLFCMQRGNTAPASRKTRIGAIVTAVAAYGASWVIIWAMTQAPVPLVSALRETSIVFAVAIGVIFFNERLNLVRLVSIATTLIGTAMLKFSR